MVIKLLWVLILMGMLVGCAYHGMKYVDVEVPIHFDYKERVIFNGTDLIVGVEQIIGLNIVDFDLKVHEGYLYLYPIRVSSGGVHAAEFRIPVRELRLKNDWIDHVYWVEEVLYPGPASWFNLKSDHRKEISRRLLHVVVEQ
jgi:hypothetical protein